jgi:hypothetical protein
MRAWQNGLGNLHEIHQSRKGSSYSEEVVHRAVQETSLDRFKNHWVEPRVLLQVDKFLEGN